ncbi:hypothetical protein ACJIZ3_004628 [Penstemon smallii]|uniref:Exocyst subunit Exo70 family protein n=1 Tax=Penstemon smallii TaxID=265156 RepID=A0ABD3S2K0_9LAMI
MEQSNPDKFNSFSKNGQIRTSPETPHSRSLCNTFDQQPKNGIRKNVIEKSKSDLSRRARITQDIDQFTDTLWAIHDKSLGPPEVPDSIEAFLTFIESRIANNSRGGRNKIFGKMNKDDVLFIEAIRRLSKLTNALSEFSSNSKTNVSLNQTSLVLQHAMTFLEEGFRGLLEDSRNFSGDLEIVRHHRKLSSFSSLNQQEYSERILESGESDEYAAYSPEIVVKMHRIASTMISAGYETECCQVYSIIRLNAIKNQMKKLEFGKINMDDVLKMPWESLDVEIRRWIKFVKNCTETIFPGEKKLVESVFSDYPLICKSMFNNLARAVVIQLLDFAEAITMAQRSAEKLFKFLDIYEALQSLDLVMEGDDKWCYEEIAASINGIGELAASSFCELEILVKNDPARTPVLGGAVHPLTRYVMNYLEYAGEYKHTLEKIFKKNQIIDRKKKSFPAPNMNSFSFEIEEEGAPYSIRVVTLMDELDSNLVRKSNLYKDPALREVFLMNNGRYILQKVKGSSEIGDVMGDNWCRRKSTAMRQYHQNYKRETWNRVLQCLNEEGLQINGKVSKTILRERFKSFTTTFDEIHRTQSMWVVTDDQLQSELRISISALVIPAYRSFLGRFRQYFDYGKQTKYIKYQPEDIESLIEGFFEGNAFSMPTRRRT